MASVAVAQHRDQYHSRKRINCRTLRPFQPKSPPKSSRFHKGPTFLEDFSYSELWAGPAYTNSPPPSSLPIPNFPLRQKRSLSLELHPLDSRGSNPTGAKSAPASPKSEPGPSSSSDFIDNTDSATENLKRILNLGF